MCVPPEVDRFHLTNGEHMVPELDLLGEPARQPGDTARQVR